MNLNIYLVSRTDKWGYDDYSDFVCYAASEEEALKMSPTAHIGWSEEHKVFMDFWKLEQEPTEHDDLDDWFHLYGWPKTIKDLKVKLLGQGSAPKPAVILASFHAG